MRRLLCALVLACSIVGFEPCAFVGLSPHPLRPWTQSARAVRSVRFAESEPVATEAPEFSEPAELPTPKTWRELRRNRRFDHSPGNWWRTQLLPEKEAQDPKLVQSNLVRARSLPRLLYLLQGDLEKWNGVNLATAWHRLAKFCQAAGTSARTGSKARNADEANEQDLQIQEMQRRLARAVMALGPEAFDARGISSLMYAWGLMRFKSKLLKPFCISARTRMKEFDNQSIANMVFGIGLLGLKGETRVLDEIGRQVPPRLNEFHIEEVVSIVYSLGKLGYSPAGGLMEVIGDYVIERVEDFDPVQLTKLVVSVNELDFNKRRLMLVLWNHLAREIKSFSTHQLVVIVRTAAKRRVRHEKFAKAVSEEVLDRLNELNRDVRLTQIMDNLKILQGLVSRKKPVPTD